VRCVGRWYMEQAMLRRVHGHRIVPIVFFPDESHFELFVIDLILQRESYDVGYNSKGGHGENQHNHHRHNTSQLYSVGPQFGSRPGHLTTCIPTKIKIIVVPPGKCWSSTTSVVISYSLWYTHSTPYIVIW
jgi:hypothetical protein